jgi:chemotaxis protein methyltransferase CheR
MSLGSDKKPNTPAGATPTLTSLLAPSHTSTQSAAQTPALSALFKQSAPAARVGASAPPPALATNAVRPLVAASIAAKSAPARTPATTRPAAAGAAPNAGLLAMRELLVKTCGVYVTDDKLYMFETRLVSMMAQAGVDNFAAFAEKARHDTTCRLLEKVVDVMTTHETSWFRDARPWQALRDGVLPEIVGQARARGQIKIRIWCAGCSTGQEPYSLAMMIDQLSRDGALGEYRPESFEIVATDVSTGTVGIARLGRFNQVDISRGLDPSWQERYFTKQGMASVVNENIRKRVTFRRHDLANDSPEPGPFQLVLCRNVTIYFTPDTRRRLFERMHGVLAPEALAMLGGAESLMGYERHYAPQVIQGATFYRRK